jgi:succinate dehydrogenase / fumarate reductase cytochrome b subunit
MSKSVLLKSSIAKKYWMAFTGLFLCLFLVGHLLGNLQLFAGGEEGRRAFNEYAYFMQHNPLIKVMSYVTYLSILFHAIDGILLAFQNKKARPIQYAMDNAASNSSSASRKMAILGSIILIFIATHMVNFWAKMHFGGLQLHTTTKTVNMPIGQNPQTGEYVNEDIEVSYILSTKGDYLDHKYKNPKTGETQERYDIKHETMVYDKSSKLKVAEGYKDLHTAVMTFFGKDAQGQKKNQYALIAILFYTLSMAVLSFHLLHGFAAAFQTLGLRHPRYTPIIKMFGTIFAIVVPALFALIPLYIFIS